MKRIIDRATGAVIGALALAVIALLAGIVEAGPLDPPGAPAPTDGVLRPGTPISSLPFTISSAGHYYVTRNLTASGAGVDGITITAHDVTVDLGGFTLAGLVGTDDGIAGSGRSNVSIRNGTLLAWDGDGINLNDGVAGSGGIIEDVSVREVLGDGIRAGSDYIVRNCVVRSAGGDGIEVTTGSAVSTCTSSLNGGDGIRSASPAVRVMDAAAVDNTGDGIEVAGQSRVSGNVAISNGVPTGDAAGIHVTGNATYVEHNVAYGNDRGFDVDAGNNTIVRNEAAGNAVEFDVVAGNALGPSVTSATIGASTNPHANYEP